VEEIGAAFERHPRTFRALPLAYEVGRVGGTAVVINAANEAAVSGFRRPDQVPQIMELVEHCLVTPD
jgi:1-deoxy-D-xylulose 5-phosphate reductoisomerase